MNFRLSLTLLSLVSISASAQTSKMLLKPKVLTVPYHIVLNADSKTAAYGNCSLEYKGIVLARRAFEGSNTFETKGSFRVNSTVREVQMRCIVNGYKPLVETVAIDQKGVEIERCLSNFNLFQKATVDIDQGVAQVHLKIPKFRREKVNVGGKTFLQLTTPDEDVNSGSYTGQPHMPEFPQTTFYLALPLDAQVSGITVKPGETTDAVNYMLVPKIDEGTPELTGSIQPIFNEKIYFGVMPEVLASRDAKFQAVIDREKNLIRVSTPLVDYSTKTGMVRFFDEMDITINFKSTSRCFRPPFRGQDAVDTLRSSSLVGLKQLVLNPNDIKSVCRSGGGNKIEGNGDTIGLRSMMMERAVATPVVGPNLVIVTPAQFRAQADQLALHKESMGIRTYVLEWKPEQTPQELKALLQQAANGGLRPNYLQWVLLLGDVDAIPTYYDDAADYVEIGDKAHTAGDAYYVQWGTAAESYVPSQSPNSSIGRIPAKTVEELQVVLDRIRNYDYNPPNTDYFYQTPTIAGTMQTLKTTDTGAKNNYAEFMEKFLASKYFATGYRPERIFRSDREEILRPSKWSDNSPIDYTTLTAPQPQTPNVLFHMDGSQELIDSAVKRGTGLLFHRGHGLTDRWLVPGYTYDAARFSLFPESMPPVIFAVSCLTGFFDSETVHNGHILQPVSDLNSSLPNQQYLAEEILLSPKGALGLVASSRQSSWGYNDRLTKGLARSLIDRKTADNTALSQRLGDVMTDAKVFAKKAEAAIDPDFLESTNRHHMLAYNLMGDPSVEIRQALPLRVAGQPTYVFNKESSQLTVRFKIVALACSGCDLKQQQDQPIAVLMNGNNQVVSRGISYPVALETGENREVILSNVTNFDSERQTIYLSNAGLATASYPTGPTIPVLQ